MYEIQYTLCLLCVFSTAITGLKLYDRCSDHTKCPANSSCRPYDCNGYSCLCNEGYVSTDDKQKCLKARLIGQTCDYTDSICMSPFAFCLGHCECMGVFQPTEDGRCKLPDMGFTGDACDELSPCHPPAACRNDTCVCESPYRPLTDAEFWVDPMHPRQCVTEDYSLDKCNNSAIFIPLALRPSTTTTKSTELTTQTIQTTTTKLNTTEETTANEYTTETTQMMENYTTTTLEFTTPTLYSEVALALTNALNVSGQRGQSNISHRVNENSTLIVLSSVKVTNPTEILENATLVYDALKTSEYNHTYISRSNSSKSLNKSDHYLSDNNLNNDNPFTNMHYEMNTPRQFLADSARNSLHLYSLADIEISPTRTFTRTNMHSPVEIIETQALYKQKYTSTKSVYSDVTNTILYSSSVSAISDKNMPSSSLLKWTDNKSLSAILEGVNNVDITQPDYHVESSIDFVSISLKREMVSQISLAGSDNNLLSDVEYRQMNSDLATHASVDIFDIYESITDMQSNDFSSQMLIESIVPVVDVNTFNSKTPTTSEFVGSYTIRNKINEDFITRSEFIIRPTSTHSFNFVTRMTTSSDVDSFYTSAVTTSSIFHTETTVVNNSEYIIINATDIKYERDGRNLSLSNTVAQTSSDILVENNFVRPDIPFFHISSQPKIPDQMLSENLLLLNENSESHSDTMMTSVQNTEEHTTEETTDVHKSEKPIFSLSRPIIPIELTLFDIGRGIYSTCFKKSQCPENASCKPNACEGYICLCDEGYIASDDRKFCLRAIRNGERCDPRSDKCLSKYSICAGVCKCLEFFESTNDGRCKLPDSGYVGEDCNTRGCQYPSTCVNGRCGCVHPYRELTLEEFWISPQSTLQCRPHEYSLNKCNGSLLEVPEDLRSNISTATSTKTLQGKHFTTSDIYYSPSAKIDDPMNIHPMSQIPVLLWPMTKNDLRKFKTKTLNNYYADDFESYTDLYIDNSDLLTTKLLTQIRSTRHRYLDLDSDKSSFSLNISSVHGSEKNTRSRFQGHIHSFKSINDTASTSNSVIDRYNQSVLPALIHILQKIPDSNKNDSYTPLNQYSKYHFSATEMNPYSSHLHEEASISYFTFSRDHSIQPSFSPTVQIRNLTTLEVGKATDSEIELENSGNNSAKIPVLFTVYSSSFVETILPHVISGNQVRSNSNSFSTIFKTLEETDTATRLVTEKNVTEWHEDRHLTSVLHLTASKYAQIKENFSHMYSMRDKFDNKPHGYVSSVNTKKTEDTFFTKKDMETPINHIIKTQSHYESVENRNISFISNTYLTRYSLFNSAHASNEELPQSSPYEWTTFLNAHGLDQGEMLDKITNFVSIDSTEYYKKPYTDGVLQEQTINGTFVSELRDAAIFLNSKTADMSYSYIENYFTNDQSLNKVISQYSTLHINAHSTSPEESDYFKDIIRSQNASFQRPSNETEVSHSFHSSLVIRSTDKHQTDNISIESFHLNTEIYSFQEAHQETNMLLFSPRTLNFVDKTKMASSPGHLFPSNQHRNGYNSIQTVTTLPSLLLNTVTFDFKKEIKSLARLFLTTEYYKTQQSETEHDLLSISHHSTGNTDSQIIEQFFPTEALPIPKSSTYIPHIYGLSKMPLLWTSDSRIFTLPAKTVDSKRYPALSDAAYVKSDQKEAINTNELGIISKANDDSENQFSEQTSPFISMLVSAQFYSDHLGVIRNNRWLITQSSPVSESLTITSVIYSINKTRSFDKVSNVTKNTANITPLLPESDFPGEKPRETVNKTGGFDQLILPLAIVGVFLVNVIAAIIVLVCRRRRQRSGRTKGLLEAKKKKIAEEQLRKKRFTIPRPNVYPSDCTNVIDNSSNESSTYYNYINTGFSTFHEDNTYEEIDKKVLKGSL